MDFECDNELGGAGDRRNMGRAREIAKVFENPGYTKRRLTNGLPIPVFVRQSQSDQRGETFESCVAFNKSENPIPPEFPSSASIAREYLSCPICRDPCIESTTINCGHKFCRECIERWRKQKPICPICSTLITCLHRSYSDDLLIESQLHTLPSEVRIRFVTAQKKRLDKLIHERNSQNLISRFRKKLDNSMTFLRCKNAANIEEKFNSASLHFRSWMNQRNFGLIIGVILVGLLILLANNMKTLINFMQYQWLALKHYDGIIPEDWLSSGVRAKKRVAQAVLETPFEAFVNSLKITRFFR